MKRRGTMRDTMFSLAICILFVCSTTRPSSGQTTVKFCSGKSFISRVSDWSDGILTIDGSDSAISARHLPSGITTCTCSITYYGTEEMESSGDENPAQNSVPSEKYGKSLDEAQPLPVVHVASVTENTGKYECGKSIKVLQVGEKAVHWLGCTPRDLEFEDVPLYATLRFTLSVDIPKAYDRKYQLEIKKVSTAAELYVHCLPPTLPTTTPSPASDWSSPKPSEPNTNPKPLSDGTDNTGIIIGVVVSIGLLCACIITVAIICIQRQRNIHVRNNMHGEDNHCKEAGEINPSKRQDLAKDNTYITLESRNNKESQSNEDTESGVYDFIRPEDLEETNEYDCISDGNAKYGQLQCSEPNSSTYTDLCNQSDYVNTNLKCEENKSFEPECPSQEDYLEPSKPIPIYLELLPN